MTLHIRGPVDTPHTRDPYRPATSLCGMPLNESVEVTEVQTIVYFGGRTCAQVLAARARLTGGSA